MRYITTIRPTLHRAMSTSPGPGVGEVEIGVRYDVDCSTEHPVSRGVLEKMLLDVEMSKYYISKWNSQAEIKVHETKELIFCKQI